MDTFRKGHHHSGEHAKGTKTRLMHDRHIDAVMVRNVRLCHVRLSNGT